MTPTPDRLRQPRTEAGPRCTCTPPDGVGRHHGDDCALFKVDAAYRQGREDEAASPVPAPTLDVDAQLLAMAMDIAMDTPILNTGLRRVDVVIREYARLAALATPDTETAE